MREKVSLTGIEGEEGYMAKNVGGLQELLMVTVDIQPDISTLVLWPHGNELCQQHELAWKHIFAPEPPGKNSTH